MKDTYDIIKFYHVWEVATVNVDEGADIEALLEESEFYDALDFTEYERSWENTTFEAK
jgi:hypothetical protein